MQHGGRPGDVRTNSLQCSGRWPCWPYTKYSETHSKVGSSTHSAALDVWLLFQMLLVPYPSCVTLRLAPTELCKPHGIHQAPLRPFSSPSSCSHPGPGEPLNIHS